MKFKDLETGKKYKVINYDGVSCYFEKKYDLLWNSSKMKWSDFSISFISIIEFEEVIEYFTFIEVLHEIEGLLEDGILHEQEIVEYTNGETTVTCDFDGDITLDTSGKYFSINDRKWFMIG